MGGHDFYVEDFMVTDLKYLSRESKYKGLRRLLKISTLKQFPLVDSQETRVLLGSIKRKHLSKILSAQLSAEKRLQHLLSQWAERVQSQEPEPAGNEKKTEKPETLKAMEHGVSNAQDSVVEEMVEEEEEKVEPSKTVQRTAASPLPQNEHVQYCNMVEEWECRRLQEPICLDEVPIDPAPYRLLEKETLYQCYDLFNLLSLRTAYVTNMGRLVGVVSLKELKTAVEGCVKGTFASSRHHRHLCRPDAQALKPSGEAEPKSPPV
ncbi:chloride channel protein 2-like [Rhineura floridana]|uniref:chloride channel protein 2-like n=1 Tax=Rhineura floridana TaxID=261503 RepID=UPI002AC8269D|nr:chloride channel protein 2-like [Rhineura floridana]